MGNGSRQPYRILPYPWDDASSFDAAAAYIEVVYERLLAQLSTALNRLHSVQQSVRYWRIIIGPWLRWYLEAFYDRYVCLLRAVEVDPAIQTIGLAGDSFSVPGDFDEFLQRYLTDEYNLQLYTQILVAIGIEMPRKAFVSRPVPDERVDGLGRFYRVSPKIISRVFDRVCEMMLRRSSVGLVGIGLRPGTAMRLCVGTGLQLATCRRFARAVPIDLGLINPETRDALKQMMTPGDAFEKVAISSIGQNIPLVYLELFEGIKKSVLGRWRTPKVLVSGAGWYSDEGFKIFAAESQEKGCRLGGIQHGGYYGMLRWMSPESHEQQISDRFYSWGWTDGLVSHACVKPMPSLRLAELQKLAAKRKRSRARRAVILVTTMHPRYLYRFQSHPVGPQWEEYTESGLRFARTLNEDVLRRLVVRLYFNSYGWGTRARWQAAFPHIQVEDARETKMAAHFKSSALLVVDHPATTFLEALAIDVPTVLFWDRRRFRERPSVGKYLDRLCTAGVMHDNPESAAQKVNSIVADIEGWWRGSQIRVVRSEFCNVYAKSEKTWLGQWQKELTEFAAN